MQRMNLKSKGLKGAALLCAVAALAGTGCKKTTGSTLNYKTALNTFYDAHPACLWAQSKKLPTQVNTSDTDKTTPYDALVDQGLLARTTGEKKELIIISRQVTNYDLSDQGRAAWTADVNQPGYGNFCYGHWSVSSIDSSTPTTDQPGATTQVSYHYALTGTPAWAVAPETQTAFPTIRANLTPGLTGAATLTNTAGGWVVTSASGSTRAANSADGTIVE
jgi:hypothetical protein